MHERIHDLFAWLNNGTESKVIVQILIDWENRTQKRGKLIQRLDKENIPADIMKQFVNRALEERKIIARYIVNNYDWAKKFLED